MVRQRKSNRLQTPPRTITYRGRKYTKQQLGAMSYRECLTNAERFRGLKWNATCKFFGNWYVYARDTKKAR